MKLKMRAQNTYKKLTLLTAAFVLAVSSLTASVPFILSQRANAVAGTTVSDISTFDAFKAALSDSTVGYINLAPHALIEAPEKLVLGRSDVRINGNDGTIRYTGPNAGVSGWQGIYVLQAYNVTNVEINSLRVAGGDAGILVNGSEVTLKGNTHVLDNEFGGVEVSKGSAPNNSKLTLQGNLWDETHLEVNGKPAVWVVNGQGSIDQTNLNSKLTAATHIKPDQTQYYLRADATGTVATNVTQAKTYLTLNAAVAAANPGDTIELDKDTTLTQMVFLNKALTLDGKGKVVTAGYSFTANGVDNAVLTINASNVTVKNLTTTNVSTGAKPHGIVVQTVQGVTLDTVTLKNGRAGVIVNGSKVVAKNITTENNSWYGLNVDKTGAELQISGANAHNDQAGKPAILVDNRGLGVVKDIDNQYVKTSYPGTTIDTYVRDPNAPVIDLDAPAEGSYVNHAVSVKATISDDNLRHYWYQVTRNGQVIKDEVVLSAGIDNQELANLTAEGVYTVQVAARDKAGGGSDTGHKTSTAVRTFTIDTSAPNIYVKTESTTGNNATVGTNPYSKVSFKLFDANKNLKEVVLNGNVYPRSGNSDWNDLNWSNITQSQLNQGTNTIVVRDKAGNEKTLTFVFDSVAPAAPVISTAPVYVNASQANNQATWTHNGADVQKFEYREYRNLTEAAADANGNTASYWVVTKPASSRSQTVGQSWTGEKTLYYRVVAIDAAGNRAVSADLGTVIIDKNAPIISDVAVTPNPAKSVDGQVTVTANLKDNYTNLQDAQYSVYDDATNTLIATGAFTGVTGKEASVSANINVWGLSVGTYRVEVSVSDAAGNKAVTPTTFVIDNDDLSTVVEINTIPTTTNTPVVSGTVRWNANNAPAANQQIVVELDGVEYDTETDANGQFTVATTKPLADNNYVAYVYVLGVDDTYSGQQARNFTIDLVPNVVVPEVNANPVQEQTPVAPQQNGGFPLANFGGVQQQVLGDATVNSSARNGASNNEGVEGASAQNKAAQAANSDSNQGRLFGLAWYWWILILAAIALLWWWIAAAIRRRKEEA